MRYVYKGPAWRFNIYVGEFQKETEAVSVQQAVSNIKAQIKQELGLLYSTKITILDDEVKIIEEKPVHIPKQTKEGESVTQLSFFPNYYERR